MKRNPLILLLILALSKASGVAFAYSLTKQSAEQFINSMYSVISTRNSDLIKNFFEYYADSSARFIYHITGIDSDLPNKIQKGTTDKGRSEFIDYLSRVTNATDKLNYQVKVTSFKLAEGGLSAVVAINAVETSVSHIPDPKRWGQSIQIRTMAATNCNINLTLAASTPIISGMNCIEKIVIK